MSEQEQPPRPPASGPGSGVKAWRAYACAVGDDSTDWESLSREEIMARLGVDAAEQAGDGPSPPPVAAPAPPRRRRPVWMAPTEDGPVPEPELRRR